MKHSQLQEVLADGCVVAWSKMTSIQSFLMSRTKHLYDRRAAAYDLVVRTWLYNRQAGHFALVTHRKEFLAALVKHVRPLAIKSER